MYDAWVAGIDAMEMKPIEAHTVADSISADLPADRIKALRAVRNTNGAYVKVTDEEIIDLFDGAESIRNTLERDPAHDRDEALLDLYRKLRRGEIRK